MLSVALPSLPKHSATLQQTINVHFAMEHIYGVECRHCSNATGMSVEHAMNKGMYLEELNENLLIHLKRFDVNPETGQSFKKHFEIHVEEVLSCIRKQSFIRRLLRKIIILEIQRLDHQTLWKLHHQIAPYLQELHLRSATLLRVQDVQVGPILDHDGSLSLLRPIEEIVKVDMVLALHDNHHLASFIIAGTNNKAVVVAVQGDEALHFRILGLMRFQEKPFCVPVAGGRR